MRRLICGTPGEPTTGSEIIVQHLHSERHDHGAIHGERVDVPGTQGLELQRHG
jgi:hypothetical protein